MTDATHEVLKEAAEHNVPNRVGAYIVAINRLIKAMKLRGMIH
jgi:glutamate dehydrogenase/leucine dehydrogenase